MLQYIIAITRELTIAVTLFCLLYTVCSEYESRRGRMVIGIGVGLGFISSVAMTIAKNTTSLIATNVWNLWIFMFITVLTVLFVLFSIFFFKKNRSANSGSLVGCILAALLIALFAFYELPEVLTYPFHFKLGDNGIISVEFLVRLLGWLGGIILMLVYGRYLCRCLNATKKFSTKLNITILAVVINAIRCVGQGLRPWLTNAKTLPDFLPVYSKASYPWAFPFASYVANHTVLFIFVISGLSLLLAIGLYFSNIKVTGMYKNPAEHRRLKATALHNRRSALVVVVCYVIFTLTLTVGVSYDTRVVALSTPESYTVKDGNFVVPITQVEDGKLHRFEHISDNNIAIRWIVVRKPNSAAYGVGLDACEVCGDAGYYQRGEQVVCKRCDVVMNINTIGFKGGCNPIPLDYEVEGGNMYFAIEDVLAGEREFK